MEKDKQKLTKKESIRRIEEEYNKFSQELLFLSEKQKQLLEEYRNKLEKIKKSKQDKK